MRRPAKALAGLAAFVAFLCPSVPAVAQTHAAPGPPGWDALTTQALERLRFYLRIPSVNPPADSRPTAILLEGWLEQEGIEVKVFASAQDKLTLVARLPGRDHSQSLLLLHHMDVVPVDLTRWPVDPFGAEIRNGFLYGRGAVDMKSIGILQLTSFIALKRSGLPLEHDLILMATPDEESGGERGAIWMTTNHWADISPRYVLDEGGFATPDLLSAEGKLTFAISVAEKKILWLKLTANGTGGHASQPDGDNANDHLLLALNQLRAMVDTTAAGRDSAVLAELRKRVGKLADNKLTRAIQKDTMSITSLRSGVGDQPKVNVIPAVAEATVDFRLLPDTDFNAFSGQVQRIVDSVPGVKIEVLHKMDRTPISSTDTPVYRALQAAILAQHPTATVTPYLVPFGTDSNALRNAGAICYGFNPILLNAELVATMHGDSERIPVDQLAPALRCYYEAVKAYCTNR